MARKLNFEQAAQTVDRATLLRGWAVQSFAQVEFMLGHFIRQAASLPEYAAIARKPERPFDRRVAQVRRILQTDGPFVPYARGLADLIDEIERYEDERHFLVHGWLEVLQRVDSHTLRFRRFSPSPPYGELSMSADIEGLADLERRITECSHLASSLFRTLYADFGFKMPDEP